MKPNKDGKITIDFNTTMFFHEMMLCPSGLRKEFICHIEEKDNEWLFRFCVKHFGDKIFVMEKGENE